MKHSKKVLLLLCLILIAIPSFTQVIERIEPVDVRSLSMGASYYTDTESFYSLFSNPAAIGLTGDKNLWPPIISMVAGGDLFNIAEITNMVTDGTSGTRPTTGEEALSEYESLYNDVNNTIGEDGFNVSSKIGGPLTFGAIKNNFGWGFANTISISAKLNLDGELLSFDIPDNFEDLTGFTQDDINSIPNLEDSLTLPMVLTTDFNTDVFLGYAVPLDLGLLGTISVGVSGRGISQFSVAYQDDLKTLYQSDTSFAFSVIPAAVSFGFGLDVGLQYKFLDMLNVALVWQDAYSPVWTNTYSSLSKIADADGSTGFEYSIIDSQLGLGASVDIPLEKLTGNIISHSAVYANYKDFLQLIDKAEKGTLYRDPLLDLAVGTEVVLFETIALRVGMNQLFPSGGIGVYLGNLKLDFSVHNEELGYIDNDWKQLTFGLAITIQQ